MDKALMFLIKLAWDSRIRLPLLIVVGFLAFDIRMQLEINIQTRRIRRRAIPRHRDENEHNDNSRNVSESSNSSWTTIDEYEVDDMEMNNVLPDLDQEMYVS